jgi:hypothetical protein
VVGFDGSLGERGGALVGAVAACVERGLRGVEGMVGLAGSSVGRGGRSQIDLQAGAAKRHAELQGQVTERETSAAAPASPRSGAGAQDLQRERSDLRGKAQKVVRPPRPTDEPNNAPSTPRPPPHMPEPRMAEGHPSPAAGGR